MVPAGAGPGRRRGGVDQRTGEMQTGRGGSTQYGVAIGYKPTSRSVLGTLMQPQSFVRESTRWTRRGRLTMSTACVGVESCALTRNSARARKRVMNRGTQKSLSWTI